MIRAEEANINTYEGLFVFSKQISELPITSEQQSRYKIGWSRVDIDKFINDCGREAMQLIKVGVIETDEVSYYSYIYVPQNKLILIYEIN